MGLYVAALIALAIHGLLVLALVLGLVLFGPLAIVFGASRILPPVVRRWHLRRALEWVLRESAAIHIDDWGISRTRPDGLLRAVSWEDLQEVVVVRWSQSQQDAVMILRGTESTVPIGQQQVPDDLLATLEQHLPGFETEVALNALDAGRETRYACWHAPT
jgi:hypothetical protein